MTDLDRAKDIFSADKFATETTGIIIDEVGPQYARCHLTIAPVHMNAAGKVMGGAIFTLADFTFAVASNLNQELTVTTTSQITYLASVEGTTLFSEAKCIKNGKTTCFYEITITDNLETKIAVVTTSGMKLNK